ncbi:MAG: hypothetical protein LBQ79_08415 [Deltaproteobacteria bacterium]|nr:hypothetical protein [Deltaproteobacteria bacterium]
MRANQSIGRSEAAEPSAAAPAGRVLGSLKAVAALPSAAAWAAAGMAVGCGTASAQGLGELGQNVTGNISGVAKAILVGGFALGLYLVISGLMEFYNANRKPNNTFGGGAVKCVVGASLLAVQAIIASFSTTLFGGNQSDKGLGTLGF